MISNLFDDLSEEEIDAKSVLFGVRWTGASQVMTESVRMLVSVTLARLLSPEDFGLLSMAGVMTGFFMVLQYLGVPGVVIQHQKLKNNLASSLFLLNMIVSLTLFSALLVAAPLLASIYKTPQLTPIIQALGAASVLTAMAAVPAALLNRRMRFDLLARVSFFSAITQGVVAIALAKMHFEVWALVIANMASSFVTVLCTWFMVGWRPKLTFVWIEVKEVMAYCLHLTGSGLINYFSRDSDKFILGKWLGEQSLGYYTMACRFCLYPPTTISPILNRVLFPAFARVQDDVLQLQKIMLRSVGAITFITLPIMAGVMVVANPFIMAVLGPKWAPAIPIMVLLSPVGYLLSIGGPANQMIMAVGRVSWIFWLTIASGILTVSAFLTGLFWGMVGVVIAYFIVMIPLTWARYWMVFRLIQLPVHKLIGALYRYFVGSVIMAGVVYGSRKFLELIGLQPLPIVCIVIPMGIILYAALMLVLRPPAVYDFYQVLPAKLRLVAGRVLAICHMSLD